MKHDAHVAHHVPGRLRIRIPSARGNAVLIEQMTQMFADMPGLEGISAKVDSGSIVVLYDPAREAEFTGHFARHAIPTAVPAPQVAPQRSQPRNEAADFMEEIEEETEFLARHSHTARVVVDLFKEIDTAIKQATGNIVDLKIVLALGLAVVTFVGVGAHAATPMWITLALFALNHFVEMHPPKATGPNPA
jgi:hypothetical protein